MTPQKAASAKSVSSTTPAEGVSSTRKAWVPKTPFDIVLEQIAKQEKRVITLEAELTQERALLGKLAKAKAALEA